MEGSTRAGGCLLTYLVAMGAVCAPAAGANWAATDGNWNVAANWNPSGVPGAGGQDDTQDDTAVINNGGIVRVTSGTYSLHSINVGSTTPGSTYIQTSGQVTLSSSFFMSRNEGTTSLAEISGGALAVDVIGVGTSAVVNATSIFRVIGSGATITSTTGFRSERKDPDGDGPLTPRIADSIVDFVLDNSANHISRIVSTAESGNVFRKGGLDVGLHGGVLLSGQSSFVLMTYAKNVSAQLVDVPDRLWLTAQNSRDTTISLDPDASVGTLDAAGPGLSFDGVNYGYVDLVNVSGSSLQVGLSVVGGAEGALDEFTGGLTAAGIGWSAGSGIYNVILNLNPSVSGDKYFAWDLSRIDGTLQVQAIGIVPEPAAGGLLLAGVALLRRRARR